MEIQVLAWDRHEKCGRIKHLVLCYVVSLCALWSLLSRG